MRIFSLTGILFYILYITVIDQAFDSISVPYQSPLKTYVPQQYKTGTVVQIGGGIAVLMLAAVFTRLTPSVF